MNLWWPGSSLTEQNLFIPTSVVEFQSSLHRGDRTEDREAVHSALYARRGTELLIQHMGDPGHLTFGRDDQ